MTAAPARSTRDGDGPFKSDNPLFSPTPVGFKNSRIRMTGYMTCRARPNGSIPAVSGTILERRADRDGRGHKLHYAAAPG